MIFLGLTKIISDVFPLGFWVWGQQALRSGFLGKLVVLSKLPYDLQRFVGDLKQSKHNSDSRFLSSATCDSLQACRSEPVEMQDLVSFEFHDHVGVSASGFTGLHPWHLCLCCGSVFLHGFGFRIESLTLRISAPGSKLGPFQCMKQSG